jgi:hypothetical protein
MSFTRNSYVILSLAALGVACAPCASHALGPDDAPRVVKGDAPPTRAEIHERLRAIANHLEAAHFQLSRQSTGQPTQADQARALALLEELIERMKERPPATPPEGPDGDKPPTGGGGTDTPPEPPKPDEPIRIGGGATPAPASKVGDELGTREVPAYDSLFRHHWELRLSPAQMERLTQELSAKFPDRYRDILAEYFKHLSEKR